MRVCEYYLIKIVKLYHRKKKTMKSNIYKPTTKQDITRMRLDTTTPMVTQFCSSLFFLLLSSQIPLENKLRHKDAILYTMF